MIFGGDTDFLKKYLLNNDGDKVDMTKYNFIKKSGCFKAGDIDDKKEFDEVVESMVTMKFTEEEIDGVWSTVSAVLHLGNVEIDDSTYDESSKRVSIWLIVSRWVLPGKEYGYDQ